MQERSLAKQLYLYLVKSKEWTPKADLTRIEWRNKKNGTTYMPETVGRDLRTLEETKMIAVKPLGVTVQYKYLPEEMKGAYIPTSERTNQNVLFSRN